MSVTSANSTPVAESVSQPSKNARVSGRLSGLALALTGVAAGVLGQILFIQKLLWEGLACYGLAVSLFCWALSSQRYPDNPKSGRLMTLESLALYTGWRQYVGLWLLLAAISSSWLGFAFFALDDGQVQAWWLYLSSLILMVSGGLLLTRGDARPTVLRDVIANRYIVIGLAAIVGLSLYLRLYNLDHLPFGVWFDEAEAGLQARRMLQEPAYRPLFYPSINITGHLLAIYAVALAWLGDTIYSLRLVSVLFGLAGVVAAYLVGRELRGLHFGLVLAFLVAVARWHVNFSRIAMTGIDTPFFEFLSLFFLLRLLRRGRLRDAMWAGLALGFGLVFYTAFRLYVLALLVYGLLAGTIWALNTSRRRNWCQWLVDTATHSSWLPNLVRVAVVLLAAWLVIIPLVQFGWENPEAFWHRTRQTSIFTKRDQPNLGLALGQNTGKHLLMFNYKGDSNGRHNLPGEPMLDPAMGILAVLGLGLALTRPRYPANAFFLILLPTALGGGIFSLDFEAPQSLRTIAVFPVIIYFVGLALVALGQEAKKAVTWLPRWWLIVPTLALAGFMLYANATTYFVRQANDFASWNAMSTAVTITGRKMNDLGPNFVYYLSPLLFNYPTHRFLAPHITAQRLLSVPDALPIREPPDRPVALFIHPDYEWVFQKAQQLYPNAEYRIFYGPSEAAPGTPALYLVTLQPEDLASIQGLELRYLLNDGTSESLLSTARAATFDATWPDDSILTIRRGQELAGNFVAEWEGILYSPRYGPYGLRLVTPAHGRLEIDGNLILDGQGEQITGLPLAQGNHTLRVEAEGGSGRVALFWQPPGQPEALIPEWALYAPQITNHGLQGTFYANERWEGQPVLQRIDPFLDFYLQPPPLNQPYTVEWAGLLAVPQNGLYRLGLRARAEAQLYVDGQALLVTSVPDEATDAAITLAAGSHQITVRLKGMADQDRIQLYWTPPTGQREPIPSKNLWPPLASYRAKPPPTGQIDVSPLQLEWLMSLGGPGAEPGQFFEPRDVATLPNGDVVVADTVNQRVQVLDPQGNPRGMIAGDELPFEEPLAVAVNQRQEILILDSARQWIYRYDAAGNFIDRFGGRTAYLFHPRELTVFDDDSMAIVDTGQGRLVLFNADGSQAGHIGGPGSGPGQFDEPTSVLRDARGSYLVAEASNHRLQQIDAVGQPLQQWAIPPGYALNGPHLAFGPEGTIFMTESQSRSLLHYTLDGTLLNRWETIGPVKLAAPVGIHFDSRTNRLYLTDVWTHQVHVFKTVAGD